MKVSFFALLLATFSCAGQTPPAVLRRQFVGLNEKEGICIDSSTSWRCPGSLQTMAQRMALHNTHHVPIVERLKDPEATA
jgi:hypothetical protein